MKTLVIHPKDNSTFFLAQSYLSLDATVVTDVNVSKSKLKELIKTHDKIIMMGHGTKDGLIATKRFVIDSSFVYLLRDKISICVWCNANEFFYKYKLKGYATGMVVSEIDEGYYYGVNCTYKEINDSNQLFGKSLKLALQSEDVRTTLLESYQGDTDVIFFNQGNL